MSNKPMKHIGLFEGIGGFSLAARWMNWDTIAYCENNEFCQKVLKHHFPKAIPHGDIKETDFSIYRGKCDIVTGGFPCQPYSVAGKRKGNADDRHLWPEMLRAIREIQPRWVVGENVPGLLNWKGGMVLTEIIADLEASGFEVFPPVILPACGKNAPHRRDRLWIVAYNNNDGCNRGNSEHEINADQRGSIAVNDIEQNATANSYKFGKANRYAKPITDGKGFVNGDNSKKLSIDSTSKRLERCREFYSENGQEPINTPSTPIANPEFIGQPRQRGPSMPSIQRRIKMGKQVGLTMMVDGQLNPLFVAEMMGYPVDWLELPYQSIA